MIRVRSVTFGYAAQQVSPTVPVLHNLSLTLNRGEFVAILGPSGCGKTTLLQIIAGLFAPWSGEVIVSADPQHLPCTILFQQLNLFYWATGAGQIETVLRVRGISRREAPRLAAELLDQVGLPGLGSRFPHQLSGGQQQRLALARVLATNAKTFLLDEPFGNLDLAGETKIETDFLRICRERELTVLMVTHDVRKAIRMADRILVFGSSAPTLRSEHLVPSPRPQQSLNDRTPERLLLEDLLCRQLLNPSEA